MTVLQPLFFGNFYLSLLVSYAKNKIVRKALIYLHFIASCRCILHIFRVHWIFMMFRLFRYLIGCDNILAKLHTKHPERCDKVGGLLAMHIDDLRALAPLWLSKTEEVREDRAHWATNITGDIYSSGWISEMYGYSFGAAEVRNFVYFILA